MIGTCNTLFRPGKHYIASETSNTGTHILYKKLKSFWSTETSLPLLKHMSSVSLSSAKPVKSGWGSRLKHYWDLICNHLSRKTKLWELGGCDQEFGSERILFKTKSHPFVLLSNVTDRFSWVKPKSSSTLSVYLDRFLWCSCMKSLL